jgi:hypothetical protein
MASSSSASSASFASSGGGGRGPLRRPAALYRPEFVVMQSFNFGFDDDVGWISVVFSALLRWVSAEGRGSEQRNPLVASATRVRIKARNTVPNVPQRLVSGPLASPREPLFFRSDPDVRHQIPCRQTV